MTRTYTCAGSVTFSGLFRDSKAVIVTASRTYVLTARRSSLGVRYGSADVAFAQDEDRAVLVGAADGPYRNCRADASR